MVVKLRDPQNGNSRTLAERVVKKRRLEIEFKRFLNQNSFSIFAIT